MATETIIAERPPADGREWECQCARCGSSCHWIDCEECDDGYDGHDCGEDTCVCQYPEDDVICQYCHGYAGWWQCLSSKEWCEANPVPGRENCGHYQVEWFVIGEHSAEEGEDAS